MSSWRMCSSNICQHGDTDKPLMALALARLGLLCACLWHCTSRQVTSCIRTEPLKNDPSHNTNYQPFLSLELFFVFYLCQPVSRLIAINTVVTLAMLHLLLVAHHLASTQHQHRRLSLPHLVHHQRIDPCHCPVRHPAM